MLKPVDLTGKRFGRLLVIQYLKNREWECICDCGNTAIVAGNHLPNGHTKSCGCVRSEIARDSRLKHGHAGKNGVRRPTPTYGSWAAMIKRCSNPNIREWEHYGGRGISVCDRWSGAEGFENFLKDMGEKPDGLSLDRYPDNNGDYEPSNCRWATQSQQIMNRRPARIIYDDEIHRIRREQQRRYREIARQSVTKAAGETS